jgi:apolipoprotein N-acyltransferase
MRRLPRWAPPFAAVLAGVAAAAAHPPFGALPGLLAYGVILRLGDDADPRRPLRSAFFRGWLAGVGYFALSVWWVVEAFLVDAATYGWMAPFALLFMASGLALFWGAALWLYRLAGPRGLGRVLVFAGALSVLEWLRAHVLTGFPWNLPGESWRAGGLVSQAASVMGVYGLTWLTIAIGAAPALLFDPVPRIRRGLAMAMASLALVALAGFGAYRLGAAGPDSSAGVRIRVVQANIDQKEKWRPENLQMVFDSYVALTTSPARVRPDVVIWPEGALPAVIDDLLAPGSPYLARLTAALQPGQTLLLGANRVETGGGGPDRYFNSLIALRREDAGLRVTGVYDKHRLVPFGEFVPMGDFAGRIGLRSLVHMPEDFTAGPPPRPLTPAGLPPVQPLICYEALFPGFTTEAAERAGLRPDWIVNVSNDAWFGATSGPWQHLNLASYRAIEEGLPIVRATPTGVSAVVDAFGRSTPQSRLGLGRSGFIDSYLPARLQPTLYSRLAETMFASMLLVSALFMGATRGLNRGA